MVQRNAGKLTLCAVVSVGAKSGLRTALEEVTAQAGCGKALELYTPDGRRVMDADELRSWHLYVAVPALAHFKRFTKRPSESDWMYALLLLPRPRST